jgi:hypothetical protein
MRDSITSTPADVPDGGLGLDGDELDEVVDLEHGPGGVGDLPDDDGGDLDRVAVGVVDLQHVGLVVADAGRDLAPLGERVDPAQPVGPDRALVAAEELDHAGLAGADRGEPDRDDQPGQEGQDAEDDREGPAARDPGDEQRGPAQHPEQREPGHGPAVRAVGDPLPHLRGRHVHVDLVEQLVRAHGALLDVPPI